MPMVKDIIASVTRLRRYGDVPNVGASGFGTGVINIKKTVQSIRFRALSGAGAPLTRAQLIADIASVRILMSGTPIVDLTATQILDLYKYYLDAKVALAAPLGELVIPFGRWDLPAWGLNRAFGLGMVRKNGGGYHTLQYEVTFTAGLATAATVEVHVEHDLYAEEPLGYHVRRLRTTRSFAGTGEQVIDDLPRTPHGVLAYHFDLTAGTLARMTIIKDGDLVYDQTPYDTITVKAKESGRTVQATMASIPFDLANDLNGYEELGSGVREWMVKPNWSVAPGAGYFIVSEEIWDDVE